MTGSSSKIQALPKTYKINEWFYSVQGEGVRAGTPSIFLRFSGCNLSCSKEVEGFDCDTEFVSGERWTADEIIQNLNEVSSDCRSLILTGGEPSLQLDEPLIGQLKARGYYLAIETNGLRALPKGIDWITVSPKTAEHTLKQREADEVKYVRSYGQGIPQPQVIAKNYLLSPAFEGDQLPEKNLEWCLQLVKKHPQWRLSLQTHKFLKIR